jgi:hypothetical protein
VIHEPIPTSGMTRGDIVELRDLARRAVASPLTDDATA